MDIKLIDRLAIIGVAAIGIGKIMLSTTEDVLEIQKNVMMDTNDIVEVEREIERKKKEHERELYFKGYTIKLKD